MAIDIPGPTSHAYFSQRLRLHYVDWGNADAPPLLLVHGGRDHCRNWDWVAEALREDWHIIAPDLRGHGDSQWMIGGSYGLSDYVYDIAQLLHQTKHQPITIIGHSLGGAISLQYTALYPETVSKLVAIEGLGWPPDQVKERENKQPEERITEWVDFTRGISGRVARRYPSIEEAFQRMQEANPHLTPDQARHLTVHGVNQNEDGTYSWKYDNYTRIRAPLAFQSLNVKNSGSASPVQHCWCAARKVGPAILKSTDEPSIFKMHRSQILKVPDTGSTTINPTSLW